MSVQAIGACASSDLKSRIKMQYNRWQQTMNRIECGGNTAQLGSIQKKPQLSVVQREQLRLEAAQHHLAEESKKTFLIKEMDRLAG